MKAGVTPVYIVILVNIAVWFVLHMLGAWLASRLPLERFYPDSLLYKTRPWEQEGLIYDKIFLVARWKKYLPDGATMFRGGFPKKHILAGREPDYYDEFVKETCRAELTHWIILFSAVLFFIWNDWIIAVWMIPYAAASNAPCIIAQRYNRPRILRYKVNLEKKYNL